MMIKAKHAVALCAVLGLGAAVLAMNGERLRLWGNPPSTARASEVPSNVSVGFKDPLDVTAEPLADIGNKPITSISRRGEGWVAVGMRGLIALAAAPEGPWQQAVVPVQSDLLSVQFIDDKHGWVVGHDGVILNSEDGGKSWVRQLDGRQLVPSFRAYYRQGAGAGAAEANAAAIGIQLEQNFAAGASLPFRDVLFTDTRSGYVVGPFGTIAGTVDGGKTWQPLLHQIDNPDFLHLNALRRIADDVYIAAEKGMVFRLDRSRGRFVALPTGYAGSLFGITGNDRVLLAFGLRGAVQRSDDAGKTWKPVPTPLANTVVSGAWLAPERRFVLASEDAQIVLADAEGLKFESFKAKQPMRYSEVRAAGNGALALSGSGGVRRETLAASVAPKQ